ncbi:MAG: pantetheine-phosphate adenylyltransferase [Planctomycetota bacterium]
MSRCAIYPGTFDPVTNGHLDLIERGRGLFDELVVAIARNPSKTPLFSPDERAAMLETLSAEWPEVIIDCFDGLVVDYVRERQAGFILRGLRSVTDFEYEYQMALTNRSLAPGIDTVFVMPDERFAYTSSTLIKDIASHGGDVSRFVPDLVARQLRAKLEGRS